MLVICTLVAIVSVPASASNRLYTDNIIEYENNKKTDYLVENAIYIDSAHSLNYSYNVQAQYRVDGGSWKNCGSNHTYVSRTKDGFYVDVEAPVDPTVQAVQFRVRVYRVKGNGVIYYQWQNTQISYLTWRTAWYRLNYDVRVYDPYQGAWGTWIKNVYSKV